MATWFAQNASVNIDSVNQWNSAANGSGSWLTWASLGASDVLVANGKTSISVNVNVTCAKLTTLATGGTAGGGFLVGTNGVVITATIEGGTTTVCTVTVTSPNAVTFAGDGYMSSTGSAYCIDLTGTGSVSITGSLYNTANLNSASTCWRNSSSGVLNINCTTMNASAVSVNSSRYVENAGSGTINFTGNVIGIGLNGGSQTSGILNSSSGTVNIVGNVTGVSSGNADSPAVRQTGSGSINITGNVSGCPAIVTGSATTAINISAGNLTVTGNVSGGAAISYAYGIYCSSSSGIITVNGNCTSSSAPAITASSGSIAALLVLNGNIVSASSGIAAVLWPKVLISSSATLTHTYRVNNSGTPGSARSLYTGGVNLNQPTVANVRSGTVFGASSEYTGTLAVPSPTLVAVGVPTDNTVGSYSASGGLDAAGVRSAIGLASANLDTQLSGLQSDTNDIQSRLPAALDGGKMTAVLDSAARVKLDASQPDCNVLRTGVEYQHTQNSSAASTVNVTIEEA